MSECNLCNGEGWVCENHPDKPWVEGSGCKCGAGASCICNSSGDLPDDFLIASAVEGTKGKWLQ